MLVTISRKCLNGAGQKQHSNSGEVAIFFLQTRKLLLPDTLAKVISLLLKRLGCKPVTLNHPSCYLYDLSGHGR
ncbi:Os03g0793550 [Oryza sativa Japonica Group]|uniref:Os03g0793550 protein n=1 Tax=Oryza sativa subsp. japonica TaxID=39947 RepID=A0A0P0W4N5_ORYSJ|nr:hypothetical protein EE612_020957 [Oryza sativa]BAS86808.1 Os03g0793550 [Oryza sativa Japonica Group]